jgi:beta-glucosidase
MDKKNTKTAASDRPEAEITARVEALLGRMSLEEKIGQLTQVSGADFFPGPKAEDVIARAGQARCFG